MPTKKRDRNTDPPQSPGGSAEVESLFEEIEGLIRASMTARQWPMKIQIERDFRGRPVLSVRIRKEDVEPELMPTLRYPE